MSKRIIVIEDNQDVRENIAEILELSGYKVETAANGIEGIRQIKNNRPDLVICDIMMPELDGYGVLHILQRSVETASIPFIFLTAKSERDDFRKGMNLGADDYITKPFDEVDLLEAIEIRLNKHVEVAKPLTDTSGDSHALNLKELLQLLNDEVEAAEERSYPRKAPVFLEGAYPRYIFKVLEGSVKESKWTEFGKELITNIYTAGDFIGWAPVIANKPYHTITATMEDSRLALIPKEQFESILKNHPSLYPLLLKIQIDKTVHLEEKHVYTAYESVRKRMAHLLVYLHHKIGQNNGGKIQLLREDIAAMAGISKETAIRVISSYKDEELISIDNNEIMVLDVEKLENVVG